MSYIIINGKRSDEVQGLIIQSLPPIVKPKIRAEITEIEGRDGDIVTKLGYSSYEKEIIIGLHGSYDIDEVISYFDTEGTIIFSDEPDKYYKFMSLEEVEYERLIRYRVAEIKLHVQPFKWSSVDGTRVFTFTGTSNTVKITNAGNIYSKPVFSFTASGDVIFTLNGNEVMTISFGSPAQTIIIDVAGMNAYDSEGNYKNRLISGDYDDLILKPGGNTLVINGAVTSATLKDFSRWI